MRTIPKHMPSTLTHMYGKVDSVCGDVHTAKLTTHVETCIVLPGGHWRGHARTLHLHVEPSIYVRQTFCCVSWLSLASPSPSVFPCFLVLSVILICLQVPGFQWDSLFNLSRSCLRHSLPPSRPLEVKEVCAEGSLLEAIGRGEELPDTYTALSATRQQATPLLHVLYIYLRTVMFYRERTDTHVRALLHELVAYHHRPLFCLYRPHPQATLHACIARAAVAAPSFPILCRHATRQAICNWLKVAACHEELAVSFHGVCAPARTKRRTIFRDVVTPVVRMMDELYILWRGHVNQGLARCI